MVMWMDSSMTCCVTNGLYMIEMSLQCQFMRLRMEEAHPIYAHSHGRSRTDSSSLTRFFEAQQCTLTYHAYVPTTLARALP
jgi:hypothetical protein